MEKLRTETLRNEQRRQSPEPSTDVSLETQLWDLPDASSPSAPSPVTESLETQSMGPPLHWNMEALGALTESRWFVLVIEWKDSFLERVQRILLMMMMRQTRLQRRQRMLCHITSLIEYSMPQIDRICENYMRYIVTCLKCCVFIMCCYFGYIDIYIPWCCPTFFPPFSPSETLHILHLFHIPQPQY